jgi:hypothetical protein
MCLGVDGMKDSERVLTERRAGRLYLEARSEDVELIHFASTVCNIFMADGSTLTITQNLDGPGLVYRIVKNGQVEDLTVTP